jgi:arylsulfatase A-like enzyme
VSGPRSLLLITVDCLRADHAGFLGYEAATTPFLDSLASQSLMFSNAIVAGAPTYYSFPAIMASRYPLAIGRDIVGLAPNEDTLATTLRGAGFRTAAFLASNPYLSNRFGYAAGFDTFQDNSLDQHPEAPDKPKNEARTWKSNLNRKLAEISRGLGPLGSLYDELYFQYCQRIASADADFDQLRRYPPADVIVDQAQQWLEAAADQPFFLWLHLMDPHAPYYPPSEALRQFGSGGVTATRARYLNSYWNRGDLTSDRLKRHLDEVVLLYDAGIRWVDAQVARLWSYLQKSGDANECVMAMTADHGEEFLDHGDRYHAHAKLTEELVRVPLLIHAPGTAQARVSDPFSLIHLSPTLLEAVGVASPKSFCGQSYWSAGVGRDSRAAVIECVSGCSNPFRAIDRMGPRRLAVRESRFKLVVDFETNQMQLFDLALDPRELRPLGDREESEARSRLLLRAHKHLADTQRSLNLSQRLSALAHDWRLAAPEKAAVKAAS